jgi:hypothetical protein
MLIMGKSLRMRDPAKVLLCCLLLPVVAPGPWKDEFVIPSTALTNSIVDIQRDPGPQPPCGKDPIPPYPRFGDPAIVKAWRKSDLGSDWNPPPCVAWREEGFSTLVTISARFSNPTGVESLLRHVGAVSELAGMRYWSTTHKQWRTLIESAYALSAPESASSRADFTSNEMTEDKVFHFVQKDNLAGRVIYRMKIVEATENRLVFGVENVSTVRYSFIPILHPGQLQSMYFMERESGGVWRYYSIIRTGKKANGLIAGNESSAVNRAVAFYRYFVGIPLTQEPPAAR